ncbi:MAG: Spy/CpxP family protein refolding chaperone [Zavarzinia sp.]|nr:Spy/CpxP family protein refolding chaperone [Zavarzinia sp.]
MNKRMIAGLGLVALLGTALAGAGTALARPDRGPGPNGGRAMSAEDMADRCTDRFARENARLAFVETKLELTDAQKPLWQAYADAVTKGNAADRDMCLTHVKARIADGDKPARPSRVEREAMRIERLEAELAQAKAEAPALTKLYDALNDGQKRVMDRPARDGGRGFTPARFERGGDCRPDAGPGRGPQGGPERDPAPGDMPVPPRG